MCECISRVNKLLGVDSEIKPVVIIRNGSLLERVHLPTYRTDNGKLENRRGKASSVMATFCPFCGERYDPLPASTEGGADAAA